MALNLIQDKGYTATVSVDVHDSNNIKLTSDKNSELSNICRDVIGKNYTGLNNIIALNGTCNIEVDCENLTLTNPNHNADIKWSDLNNKNITNLSDYIDSDKIIQLPDTTIGSGYHYDPNKMCIGNSSGFNKNITESPYTISSSNKFGSTAGSCIYDSNKTLKLHPNGNYCENGINITTGECNN